jgi:hypothetical protein
MGPSSSGSASAALVAAREGIDASAVRLWTTAAVLAAVALAVAIVVTRRRRAPVTRALGPLGFVMITRRRDVPPLLQGQVSAKAWVGTRSGREIEVALVRVRDPLVQSRIGLLRLATTPVAAAVATPAAALPGPSSAPNRVGRFLWLGYEVGEEAHLLGARPDKEALEGLVIGGLLRMPSGHHVAVARDGDLLHVVTPEGDAVAVVDHLVRVADALGLRPAVHATPPIPPTGRLR